MDYFEVRSTWDLSMTVLLLPRGLNERVVKRVKENEIWSQVVQPVLDVRCQSRPNRVIMCYDGFGDGAGRDSEATKGNLERLLGRAKVVSFSFWKIP